MAKVAAAARRAETPQRAASLILETPRDEPDSLAPLTCLISSGHFNLGERPRLLQLNNTAA
ncbi:hypothetical protein ISF53_28560 [Burkholderia pseudomallei]|nr:hypothetical protein [Burkholderia pseudomallei]